jgi:hypothetical protein
VRLLAVIAVAALLGGCAGTSRHQPPNVFPAAEHQATIARIDAFLPAARAEMQQCQGQDRLLLDSYLSGLRGLRLAPEGAAQTASDTIAWFDKAYHDCRQKMAALQTRLADIDTRCRDAPTRLGMTEAEVLKSCWSAPDHVIRAYSSKHSHDEWVYPGIGQLYFTDGVLTRIHQSGASERYIHRLGKPGP